MRVFQLMFDVVPGSSGLRPRVQLRPCSTGGSAAVAHPARVEATSILGSGIADHDPLTRRIAVDTIDSTQSISGPKLIDLAELLSSPQWKHSGVVDIDFRARHYRPDHLWTHILVYTMSDQYPERGGDLIPVRTESSSLKLFNT